MSHTIDLTQLLGWIDKPAFCVENGVITQVNAAAAACMIPTQVCAADLISAGKEEYAAYADGQLYLSMNINGHSWDACVHTAGNAHIFVLEHGEEQPELRAMALAAMELRMPLADLMTAADHLLPAIGQGNPALAEQSARMNQSLHRILRLVANMSDAARYRAETAARRETMDICAFLEEVFQKASALSQSAGGSLSYTGPRDSILCLVDSEKLERAVYNILSNAIKHTPKGGTVTARLQRHQKRLQLTVHDSGSGIPAQLQSSLYTRYTRQPGLEDSLNGIGLGMSLICSAARAHGGTVLLEQPKSGGTKVTLTLAITQSKDAAVRSPWLKVDYAGGRDHALIELSESLPAGAFQSSSIN